MTAGEKKGESIPHSRFPISGSDSGSVAVLALQGDFEAHRKKLGQIGIEAFEARKPEQLEEAAGLVIPGGESTTLWKFFESAPWEEALKRFAASGRPILGTCAGAIVLAREVTNPRQKGLGILDASIERNAYGRQADSFVGSARAPILGGDIPAIFI
ncbi:MAG: pyridoxal 5'-phosphate synthase glutaminase subunit PdxT, partial [Thermoanaerobaculia bacterium]